MIITEVKNPNKCGESIKNCGVFICRLGCIPCPCVCDKNAECNLERANDLMLALANMFHINDEVSE